MEMLNDEIISQMRIPYALHRVPKESFVRLLPYLPPPEPGDIALAQVENIGKNANLELATGRRSAMHVGDLIAVVFGNRYATRQFEGYAAVNGDRCDLLSMGGLCGLVRSKHASVSEPTKLRLVGALGNGDSQPLKLRNFALSNGLTVRHPQPPRPRIAVVCGTSMDSGKTYTVMSLICGLRQEGHRVASIKLTGTAAGSDKWSMLDAGAQVALDFTDGGFPSTYLCKLDNLLDLFSLLLSNASSQGVDWVVIEVADGLLQRETAALLQSSHFTKRIDAWILTASEALGALGGTSVLRGWGIEPLAISGVVSMGPLAVREVQEATEVPCLTAVELQRGDLNARLLGQKQLHDTSYSAQFHCEMNRALQA